MLLIIILMGCCVYIPQDTNKRRRGFLPYIVHLDHMHQNTDLCTGSRNRPARIHTRRHVGIHPWYIFSMGPLLFLVDMYRLVCQSHYDHCQAGIGLHLHMG